MVAEDLLEAEVEAVANNNLKMIREAELGAVESDNPEELLEV